MTPRSRRTLDTLITLIPILGLLIVFFSGLAFYPVPWPDDSAFYFVAREAFRWPPRWVMIPQAPFEPGYYEWNFNTMPLYPILIGVGRWLGIEGSRLLKLWPLGFWALSGSLLIRTLLQQNLPRAMAALLAILWSLEPNLRWASVLVRPESLIGFAGMALVLGMTFGFPSRLAARGRFWDPVAALLAIGAYAHFNSVHLVFAVMLSFAYGVRRLVRIGGLTTLYLSPWILTVVLKPRLFLQEMETQWQRLAVPNGWLDSVRQAFTDLFPDMGNPHPWPELTYGLGFPLWLCILGALAVVALTGVVRLVPRLPLALKSLGASWGRLAPAAGWLLGACWLWETKPEVWFTYYIHAAGWTFFSLVMLEVAKSFRKLSEKSVSLKNRKQALPNALERNLTYAGASQFLLVSLAVASVGITLSIAWHQGTSPQNQTSWNWKTYRSLVDCVDSELIALEKRLGSPKPFHVWGPTFPDILIELSVRHPDWEFTRTNDFHPRRNLAIAHGRNVVHTMVTTETIQSQERWLTGDQREFPQIRSTWMEWDAYYLNAFMQFPDWMPARKLCQRGRWQAFIYMRN